MMNKRDGVYTTFKRGYSETRSCHSNSSSCNNGHEFWETLLRLTAACRKKSSSTFITFYLDFLRLH